jgi:CheY-like chemotaxis protein
MIDHYLHSYPQNSHPQTDQKRILIIAEDHHTRTRMVQIFEDGGYAVLVAQDSVEVLTLIDLHQPHAVVLVATFPATMGLDVLEPLRGRRPPTMIPAILLSTDATLVLDTDCHQPRMLSDQPIALHDVLAHVDQLTLS